MSPVRLFIILIEDVLLRISSILRAIFSEVGYFLKCEVKRLVLPVSFPVLLPASCLTPGGLLDILFLNTLRAQVFKNKFEDSTTFGAVADAHSLSPPNLIRIKIVPL
jgi:hypothetical protein